MYDTCSGCGYDLSGLEREGVTVCPECGTEISHRAIALKLFRLRRKYWRVFFFGPVLALPGCAAYVVGQPILCMVICTVYAFRALLMDDAIHEREPMRGAMFVQSLLFALAWTAGGTVLIVVGVASLSTLIGHSRH